MRSTKAEFWQRFQKYYGDFHSLGLALDLSRMHFPDNYFQQMSPLAEKAFADMAEVERGETANRDENRRVGHYWLRNPALAPEPAIRQEIEQVVADIKTFANDVHQGKIRGVRGVFRNLLLIGIGGSALGPQFVADALGNPGTDKIKPFFFDNTDPDGMDKVLAQLGSELGQTLCVVISKSGGTQETRNGMLEAQHAYKQAGVWFSDHAIAITKHHSALDNVAAEQKWLRRFPMWDWVGGRTSVCSAVGLLPAALQGLNIGQLLAGARACDEITRVPDVRKNPAAQMALMWFHAGKGHGAKDLVVIPYKDRLVLFPKYLQQLIMESLGKEEDREKNIVNQGLAVYGNKGSTDQHAYIQQLIDGMDNFFVTFIEVQKDRDGEPFFVETDVTSGDYLSGFLIGTREALAEKNRESMTLTIGEVSAFSVGVLIALFERSVGFYASMININAYHQPGVEAGKKAAVRVIQLQIAMLSLLRKRKREQLTAQQIAEALSAGDEAETVFKVCEHLAANPERGLQKTTAIEPGLSKYWIP